ncbi:MAG: patatin-like phospholipase family protein [Acidobacteriota bacterium]|nr:patatin-like phospholipase family protein [Acidobacteriota bacterium]
MLFFKARKNTNISADEKSIGEESENTLVSQAKKILGGKQATLDEILALSKKLKVEKNFTYARRLLERASNHPEIEQSKKKLEIHQQWSLCTYKDTDLSADKRLDDALKILDKADDLKQTTNQETLGLAGAIYKRKWEVDNQKLQLERSLLYYERGYRQGAENDQGYTGINAAFVLDLLAYQEEDAAKKANSISETAPERRKKARRIREDILEKVLPLAERSETDWLAGEWWFYATVAEAFFGIKKCDEAVEWLRRGREKIGAIPEWEMESTILQLARLAILQSDSGLAGDEFDKTPAWQALEKFYGVNSAAVRSAFTGKIGLALSGGGFRAALFHIGTLAKLAELDVLRRVEVLSCVSGGSIVGAHYYLEVRKLLQSKPDDEITKQDYIEIIRRIEKDFLEGVQRNVRMRIAAEFTTNLKMIFFSRYSRTLRAGELYEEEIFSKVKDGEETEPRYLNRINIYPKGEAKDFAPKLHNWRRAAKAPILVLNATTLNTGHNWQFTTTWMGEPPSSIDTEVDTNDQLRRMYYAEAPEEHQNIRLGHAVSASAGVPGIFEPLSLENLYHDRIVRLVDGGVCDDQGLSSLLEQDCTVILVSDGSG